MVEASILTQKKEHRTYVILHSMENSAENAKRMRPNAMATHQLCNVCVCVCMCVEKQFPMIAIEAVSGII